MGPPGLCCVGNRWFVKWRGQARFSNAHCTPISKWRTKPDVFRAQKLDPLAALDCSVLEEHICGLSFVVLEGKVEAYYWQDLFSILLLFWSVKIAVKLCCLFLSLFLPTRLKRLFVGFFGTDECLGKKIEAYHLDSGLHSANDADWYVPWFFVPLSDLWLIVLFQATYCFRQLTHESLGK